MKIIYNPFIAFTIAYFLLHSPITCANAAEVQYKDQAEATTLAEKRYQDSIVVGTNRTALYLPQLLGKKVGVTVNQSSLLDGKRLIDTLLSLGVDIVRGFGPEHGLSGKTAANTFINHGKDEKTGIPVTSLFGEYQKPTKEDLKEVEVMLFDMQDVGVRFYTYISTLHYVMEACAEQNIEVIVLDRPNPNDAYIDGPILEAPFKSFIGMHPVPIVHGMTIGEYAHMINGEGWLSNGAQCQLKVVPMLNYAHGKSYTLPVSPSPNLNTQRSIYLYPSLCWFGATIISDGRGTYFPFQLLGSPGLKGQYTFSFKPEPIAGMSEHPMHEGQVCYGVDLRDYDVSQFRQNGQLNLQWLIDLYQAYPNKELFFNKELGAAPGAILHFDQLAGNHALRQQIKAGLPEKAIRASWEPALSEYKEMRKKYLLYQ